jgi:hypothetical protein
MAIVRRILILAVALFCSGIACVQGQAAKTDQSTIMVTLPPQLDPSGKTRPLRHGTRVFKDTLVDVSYWILQNGKAADKQITLRDVVSVRHLTAQTLITFANGKSKSFPPDATIVRIRAFSFAKPGQPLPSAFNSRRPDYIVP